MLNDYGYIDKAIANKYDKQSGTSWMRRTECRLSRAVYRQQDM